MNERSGHGERREATVVVADFDCPQVSAFGLPSTDVLSKLPIQMDLAGPSPRGRVNRLSGIRRRCSSLSIERGRGSPAHLAAAMSGERVWEPARPRHLAAGTDRVRSQPPATQRLCAVRTASATAWPMTEPTPTCRVLATYGVGDRQARPILARWLRRITAAAGLSPRGRGSRSAGAWLQRRRGSIPAWAGEPAQPSLE